MLSTMLGFPEGMSHHHVFPTEAPRVGIIMNLKRFDVLFDNKNLYRKVVSFFFACFPLMRKNDICE